MEDYKELQKSLIEGMEPKVKELVTNFIKRGISANDIIVQGLIPGMSEVGRRFKNGDMFIPEVMLSARVMSTVMTQLEPLLVGNPVQTLGKVVIGTVENDVHNIGKDLVSMILRSGGFTVIDLGVQVPAEKFLDAIFTQKPDVLGMSALLTTTMPRMKEVIKLLEKKGLRDQVQIIVGGAPVTKEFADEIGANGYAPDAGSAIDKVKELLGIE